MLSIEDLTARFENLQSATGNRWSVDTIIPGRLHLSRAAGKEYALFLEGDAGSFGKLPGAPGIRHARGVIALPEHRELEALRLLSSRVANGNRIMAHIAYEFGRRLELDPRITNQQLLAEAHWVLVLLGSATHETLSRERQVGLVGECMLLRRLLQVASRVGIGATAVLDRWWGYTPAKRDFAAQGLVIEVKATTDTVRRHRISSLDQLEPQGEEAVYLYSVGLKSDPTAVRKLPAFVDDVIALLVHTDGTPHLPAREQLRGQLLAYGYDGDDRAFYESEPGFLKAHLPGALFPVAALDRLRLDSFVGGVLPKTVTRVAYDLTLMVDPLDESSATAALEALLHAPPTSAKT